MHLTFRTSDGPALPQQPPKEGDSSIVMKDAVFMIGAPYHGRLTRSTTAKIPPADAATAARPRVAGRCLHWRHSAAEPAPARHDEHRRPEHQPARHRGAAAVLLRGI